MKKIVIIGPAYPLRGGLATFNERFARAFATEGHEAILYSFSLQYPGFLFPGKSQYSDGPAPTQLTIKTRINSINPLNWFAVGRELKKLQPDIILVRFWLPFMGPALGTILRFVRKNKHTVIIALTDNVIPHEKRPGDSAFTRYFLSSCHAFITMSDKVMHDLRLFEPVKPAVQVVHPLYDNFGDSVSRSDARAYLKLDSNGKLLLFFGFIRRYKGLDLLLEAMALVKKHYTAAGTTLPRLLIAGEFYENEQPYLDQIRQFELEDVIILHNHFIPDQEVRYYLCAADVVVQPYRTATQSGVTPLAYHFEKPMIVTRAGNLPVMVPHEKSGLVADIDPASLADAIIRYFELGEQFFITHLRREKAGYSWTKLVEAVTSLAEQVNLK